MDTLLQNQSECNQQPSITFSKVVNALFYLLTIAIIGYYLWTWWQNTTRLKKSLSMLHTSQQTKKLAKEGFSGDESNTLSLEKPLATQAKINCRDSPYKLSHSSTNTTGVWDGEEDGHILFEEPIRRWTDTRLGDNKYSPGVNQALDELKTKYQTLITETTGQMLNALSDAELSNYLTIFTDLDKMVTANSQISQLKGMMQAQTEQLDRIKSALNEIIDISKDPESAYSKKWQQEPTGDVTDELYTPIWLQSRMSREELGRQIIRNRQMREYLEQRITNGELSSSTANIDVYDYIIQTPNIATGLVYICDKLTGAYKILLPLLDEVISKRAKYEKETLEIRDLVDILPDQNGLTHGSAELANGQNGGRDQVPEGVLGSDSTNKSPTSDRWPQRYYLNAQSARKFKVTKDLDLLRTKVTDPLGFTKEEYDAKYNWVDRVGADILPVPDDPEIKYALPNIMQRTIPDILSDFDHNNANCQRIYGECSTRTNVPGFPLPNWDTADYYDYLDRLPDAKRAANGETPSIK